MRILFTATEYLQHSAFYSQIRHYWKECWLSWFWNSFAFVPSKCFLRRQKKIAFATLESFGPWNFVQIMFVISKTVCVGSQTDQTLMLTARLSRLHKKNEMMIRMTFVQTPSALSRNKYLLSSPSALLPMNMFFVVLAGVWSTECFWTNFAFERSVIRMSQAMSKQCLMTAQDFFANTTLCSLSMNRFHVM